MITTGQKNKCMLPSYFNDITYVPAHQSRKCKEKLNEISMLEHMINLMQWSSIPYLQRIVLSTSKVIFFFWRVRYFHTLYCFSFSSNIFLTLLSIFNLCRCLLISWASFCLLLYIWRVGDSSGANACSESGFS